MGGYYCQTCNQWVGNYQLHYCTDNPYFPRYPVIPYVPPTPSCEHCYCQKINVKKIPHKKCCNCGNQRTV